MADIIDFNSGDMTQSIEQNTLVKDILQEVLRQSDNIQELLIIVKDKDDDKTLLHTTLSLEDLSVFSSLLQHEIFNELSSNRQIEFQPDL